MDSEHKLLFRYRNDYYYFRSEILAQYIESKCGERMTTKRRVKCDFTHMLITDGIDIDTNPTPLCGFL